MVFEAPESIFRSCLFHDLSRPCLFFLDLPPWLLESHWTFFFFFHCHLNGSIYRSCLLLLNTMSITELHCCSCFWITSGTTCRTFNRELFVCLFVVCISCPSSPVLFIKCDILSPPRARMRGVWASPATVALEVLGPLRIPLQYLSDSMMPKISKSYVTSSFVPGKTTKGVYLLRKS